MDNIRGLDHVGITVPDIQLATRFLADAFRAEVIYDSLSRAEAPKGGSDAEHTLNREHGTLITAVRMIRLQHGPGIELFEMHGPKQRSPQRPSDFGLQHFAVYVDDTAAAMARFEAGRRNIVRNTRPAFSSGAWRWQSVLLWPPTVGRSNRADHVSFTAAV